MRGLLMVMFCAAVLLAFAEAEKRKLIRKTKYGKVRGTKTNLAQVFYGIPYAAPAQRWTAPEDPSPWRGTYDARTAKPMCYQSESCMDIPLECAPLTSEDCLYLNIFAPLDTRKSSKKAVIFDIHGGRFEFGTGAGILYNAEMLANKGDVIVVTMNYRLGAFGFLVTGNSPDDIVGNYGLKDQQLALKWVHKNIRRFGGDNTKITISGQSAGAYSVAIFLSSGKVDDLFARAILESSPFSIPLKPFDIAIEQGRTFAGLAQCLHNGSANATCLRSLSASVIADFQGEYESSQFPDSTLRSFMPWVPHIDGDDVKTGLIDGFRNTSIPPKQVILGTVKDDGLPEIMGLFQDPVPYIAAVQIVNVLVPNAPEGIWGLYAVDDPADARETLAEMTTDYMYGCPVRMVARELSNRMPVYVYLFDQPVYFQELFTGNPFCEDRVCHTAELPFVFQSAREEPFLFDEDQVALSDKIVSFWSSFAKYGNPKRDLVNGTKWMRYLYKVGQNKERTIVINGDGPALLHVKGYRSEFCNAWDLTGYQ